MEVYMQFSGYLDTKEAARRCGLSASWLAKLRLTGGGAPYLKLGRRVLYEGQEFEQWLGSHRRQSTCQQTA
jgi:hypothetical protein